MQEVVEYESINKSKRSTSQSQYSKLINLQVGGEPKRISFTPYSGCKFGK